MWRSQAARAAAVCVCVFVCVCVCVCECVCVFVCSSSTLSPHQYLAASILAQASDHTLWICVRMCVCNGVCPLPRPQITHFGYVCVSVCV